MGSCALTSGPVPSNLRANAEIGTDVLFKYSSTENEVAVCGNGEPCHGLNIGDTVETDEILNKHGDCHSTNHGGIFENINAGSSYTAGTQFQSNGSGRIITYASGTANGVFLNSGTADDGNCKIKLYAR